MVLAKHLSKPNHMKLLIAVLATLAFTTISWGQSGNPQEAAIPSKLADKIYRAQEHSATCWAACNSMLLAAEGIESSEEDQMERMRPFLPDGGINGAGANFLHASKALGGTYGDRTIQPWFIDRRTPPVDPSMNKKFVSLIKQGRPVIVATPQHGMVAIAVKFSILPNGYCEISGIMVNDPNPAVRGSRWLPSTELGAVFGFMSINAVTNKTADGKDGVQENEEDKPKINLAGTWRGVISRLDLTVVVRIRASGDGYTAKTDSPNQGVGGFETGVTVTGTDVELDIATPNPSSFSGTLKEKSIEGTFSQGGGNWPLRLRKQ